jgi:hypothetical protein
MVLYIAKKANASGIGKKEGMNVFIPISFVKGCGLYFCYKNNTMYPDPLKCFFMLYATCFFSETRFSQSADSFAWIRLPGLKGGKRRALRPHRTPVEAMALLKKVARNAFVCAVKQH